MGVDWIEYDEKIEGRCVYCGANKEYVYYIGGECECGVEWELECSDGVDLEGYNNIDMALEMER